MNFSPDQISKLPPELRKAWDLAELIRHDGTDFSIGNAYQRDITVALTWGLQVVEERDAAKVSRDIWFECAKQQEAKIQTAEATIATMTRERDEAMQALNDVVERHTALGLERTKAVVPAIFKLSPKGSENALAWLHKMFGVKDHGVIGDSVNIVVTKSGDVSLGACLVDREGNSWRLSEALEAYAASLKQETQPPNEGPLLTDQQRQLIAGMTGDDAKRNLLAMSEDYERLRRAYWRVSDSKAASSSPLETPAVTRSPLVCEGENNGLPITDQQRVSSQKGYQRGSVATNGRNEVSQMPAQGSNEEGSGIVRLADSESLPILQVREVAATPAPADTGAADAHCKLCGQKENCSVHEDIDRKYWHAFVSDLPLSEAEIDEAFAGMATDEAYQKMMLELCAECGDPKGSGTHWGHGGFAETEEKPSDLSLSGTHIARVTVQSEGDSKPSIAQAHIKTCSCTECIQKQAQTLQATSGGGVPFAEFEKQRGAFSSQEIPAARPWNCICSEAYGVTPEKCGAHSDKINVASTGDTPQPPKTRNAVRWLEDMGYGFNGSFDLNANRMWRGYEIKEILELFALGFPESGRTDPYAPEIAATGKTPDAGEEKEK